MIDNAITLSKLLAELKESGEDKFRSIHPHPFLLLQRYPIVEAPQKFHFERIKDEEKATEAAATKFDGLASAREKEPLGLELLVVELKKTATHEPSKITVGRISGNDVVIRQQQLSRLHAYFIVSEKNKEYQLVDNGSVNGTRINGTPLPPHQPTPVQDGNALSFWEYEFLFMSVESLIIHLQKLQTIFPE